MSFTESAWEDTRRRRARWDEMARLRSVKGTNYYHRRLVEVYRHLIPRGKRVLELGCGRGDLLAALEPSFGVGVDFSFEMVYQAKKLHPQLYFVQADAHHLPVSGQFDYVILSDLVKDLWDVQGVLKELHGVVVSHTRLILNFLNSLWNGPLWFAKIPGLAHDGPPPNRFSPRDLVGLLNLADFELLKKWGEILIPFYLPVFTSLFNRYLIKCFPFSLFALSHFFVVRPLTQKGKDIKPSVSVIIPARNEAGNIPGIMERIPEMGEKMEVIFVEGHSTDGTYEAIEREISAYPARKVRLLKQQGEGKKDAIKLGFAYTQGDILIILDADLTVAPEDLSRFYEVLSTGKGEFACGVRFVYPREKGAMRFLNLLGNKFFSYAFTFLSGQPITDTLCGTKALLRADYGRMGEVLPPSCDKLDPFGDFSLLLGATRLNLKICEIPVRYRERNYGETNIKRFRDGLLLLRMVFFALRYVKFF